MSKKRKSYRAEFKTKVVTPAAKKEAVRMMMHRGISQRQTCRMLGVSRTLLAYTPRQPAKDKRLIEPIKTLSET